jgi:excisionase family DNA binding protein
MVLDSQSKFIGLDSRRIGFSAKEVAMMLDRHVETIYAGIQSGKIPARKLGREHLIPRWWVDQWLTHTTERDAIK